MFSHELSNQSVSSFSYCLLTTNLHLSIAFLTNLSDPFYTIKIILFTVSRIVLLNDTAYKPEIYLFTNVYIMTFDSYLST